MKGKLYLIPTTLGDTEPLEVMPISVKKVIEHLDFFIVENEKSARGFIKKITPNKSQPSLELLLLDKYSNDIETQNYLDVCEKGISIGLLSDAGVPAVADPGAMIVKLAHEKGIQVVPLVGPSSILMAMMGSGMNGQSFAFNGYLPIDKSDRKRAIKELEKLSSVKNQSQIFIETPYRNEKMLDDLRNVLSADTRVCVACDITLPSEYIKTFTVKEWKHIKTDLHKRPTIFIIHK
ncbi:SAM-dependent methyltransferase [Tenacibaculum finnmarkense genomovar finnmarkense]|uniref:SAM-dependent methyltransferase n=2 Tax=Tenacibaculum finnmarkense TaxID=2781243 RepID=A0A2I2M7M2_9FLAO|nr:SAM-dependent methyltransferase [Tenacibaculum finnmarkense]MBE7634695.1 SAM-dependent methyltransferase [Tenacibaculum finnmarkense genomovar ulcerans]MBE7646598.1 SAM-dependent methyltransferase [Tenacibaculum finnmarkense genomovar ulcerans]MBE7653421.1 SAM-dependent methyltransferase [Tenacibaculum finnmarkense genomovar finnmarkense]MBE7660543.1 SAM-dependent methyltransferase [Tenacibaculum finnmarkense genomovar finnmarkense]MBE7693508.1 SAM-dependent methyltransferase [Tenacibaculum